MERTNIINKIPIQFGYCLFKAICSEEQGPIQSSNVNMFMVADSNIFVAFCDLLNERSFNGNQNHVPNCTFKMWLHSAQRSQKIACDRIVKILSATEIRTARIKLPIFLLLSLAGFENIDFFFALFHTGFHYSRITFASVGKYNNVAQHVNRSKSPAHSKSRFVKMILFSLFLVRALFNHTVFFNVRWIWFLSNASQLKC